MNRTIIITLLLILISPRIYSENLAQMGDSAYNKGDYTTALEHYQTAMATDGTSAELLYNIGNTYYRTGNIPQAIIAYERSLRLDPANAYTRQNLEFVNSKIIDKPGAYHSFLTQASQAMARSMSSNAWAWCGLAVFACFILCAFLYFFTDNVLIKKCGFFSGIAFFLVSIICIIESFYSMQLSESRDEAIVTAKSTILSTSPRTPVNRNEEAMLLHEGTKLYIQDSIKIDNDSTKTTWYDVKVDNEHRAWISAESIEII